MRMMDFKTYLLNRGEALNTIRARENTVKDFEAWNDENTIDYDSIMSYIMHCKEKGNVVHTIRLKIKSLEYYFDYLIAQNQITQNPARLVKLKGGVRKIPHNLLSEQELKEIYDLQTSYGLAQKRNKVLLSLVVFQGVGSKELNLIELKDVDLLNGKIYVPGARTTNARTLDLKAQQLLLFQDYIINVRTTILRESNKTSDYFLVNHGQGVNLLTNVISILLRKLRPYYPKLKNLQQVRQSVISEWLKQYGLRKTQYMSGHRHVSSTERYNVDRIEGLKKELKTHYIIGK
jgi:integrase/recombinase XerD